MSQKRDLEKLHERGERVTVRWPGGPYDFVLEFGYAEPSTMSGWEDARPPMLPTSPAEACAHE